MTTFTKSELPAHVAEDLGFALRRATESAAIAAYEWIGRGREDDGDGSAVNSMRETLATIPIDALVVIGEGEKDNAPQLYNGETVGDPNAKFKADLAVDPVEGTSYLAKGMTNALATLAVAPRGAMFDPGPAFYMEKLIVPAQAADAIDPTAPVPVVLEDLSKALGKPVAELTVYILEKPRHNDLVAEIHKAGARVALYPAGDVAGALKAGLDDPEIDALMGTGGTPEGILTACALRSIGAQMFARLDPQLESERKAVAEAGLSTTEWLSLDDLVSSDATWFCATGITSGLLVDGVERLPRGYRTHTLVTDGITKHQHVLTSWIPATTYAGAE